MALCPGCGKTIRDDIWVCGFCGDLVAGKSGAANGASPYAAATAAPGAIAPAASAVGAYGGDPGVYDGGHLGGGPAGAGGGYLGASYAGPGGSAGAGGAFAAAGGPGTYGSGPAGAGGGYPGASYAGAGGGSAGAGYGAPSPLPLPASTKSARKSSGSQAVLLASVFGIVAVVAIVAVWFFVLRGGGGGDFSAYLGEWQLTVPGSTAGLSLTIADDDGEPQMMIGTAGTYAGQTAAQTAGPFKMQLSDGVLVTSLEAAEGASEEQKVASEAARAALGAVVDDFKMVFAPGGTADTLSLTMEGDIQGDGLLAGSMSSQAVILTRAPGTTSTL